MSSPPRQRQQIVIAQVLLRWPPSRPAPMDAVATTISNAALQRHALLAGSDPACRELGDKCVRMEPLAAEPFGEGRLELLIREAARTNADLAMHGEGKRSNVAHHLW